MHFLFKFKRWTSLGWKEVTFFGKIFRLNWILGLLYHLIIMAWLTNSQDSCYRKMDLDVHSEDCKLKNHCATLCGFFFSSRCIISALVWLLTLKQVDRISIEVAFSFSLNSEMTTSYFGEEKIVKHFLSLQLFCTIKRFCLRLICEVPKILKVNNVSQWLGLEDKKKGVQSPGISTRYRRQRVMLISVIATNVTFPCSCRYLCDIGISFCSFAWRVRVHVP